MSEIQESLWKFVLECERSGLFTHREVLELEKEAHGLGPTVMLLEELRRFAIEQPEDGPRKFAEAIKRNLYPEP